MPHLPKALLVACKLNDHSLHMRQIISILLCFIFVATSKGQDTAYDPVVTITVKPKPVKPKPIIPPVVVPDKIKILSLKNYNPSEFRNSKSILFCNMVVDDIDNIMNRNDKIISINIKGYADGLVNPGLTFSNENLCNECSKYIDLSKKIDDEHLAILRACEIEGQLRGLLANKSYFIYVSLTNSYFDIPDGGLSGNEYRKVEVQITYLNRK
jgi:hypothetical protein